MAITNGTVFSVRTIESGAWDPKWQCAEILFTMSGAYATANGSTLLAVAALITASRRNGMTATLRGVMPGRPGTLQSDNSALSLKTVAISTNDVTFKLCGPDWATEIADGAIGAQNRPFSLMVAFTES